MFPPLLFTRTTATSHEHIHPSWPGSLVFWADNRPPGLSSSAPSVPIGLHSFDAGTASLEVCLVYLLLLFLPRRREDNGYASIDCASVENVDIVTECSRTEGWVCVEFVAVVRKCFSQRKCQPCLSTCLTAAGRAQITSLFGG